MNFAVIAFYNVSEGWLKIFQGVDLKRQSVTLHNRWRIIVNLMTKTIL